MNTTTKTSLKCPDADNCLFIHTFLAHIHKLIPCNRNENCYSHLLPRACVIEHIDKFHGKGQVMLSLTNALTSDRDILSSDNMPKVTEISDTGDISDFTETGNIDDVTDMHNVTSVTSVTSVTNVTNVSDVGDIDDDTTNLVDLENKMASLNPNSAEYRPIEKRSTPPISPRTTTSRPGDTRKTTKRASQSPRKKNVGLKSEKAQVVKPLNLSGSVSSLNQDIQQKTPSPKKYTISPRRTNAPTLDDAVIRDTPSGIITPFILSKMEYVKAHAQLNGCTFATKLRIPEVVRENPHDPNSEIHVFGLGTCGLPRERGGLFCEYHLPTMTNISMKSEGRWRKEKKDDESADEND